MFIFINDVETADWVYAIDTVPMYERNLDFTQIYGGVKFNVTKHCPHIGLISEGDEVRIHLDFGLIGTDNIIYRGYINTIEPDDFYSIKINVNHIFEKLKDIRLLNGRADEDGIFQLNQYFQELDDDESSYKTVRKVVNAIMQNIGMTVSEGVIRMIWDGGTLKTNALNEFDLGGHFSMWGQDYIYDKDDPTQYPTATNELDKSPTLWDLLELLQAVFHFKIRLSSKDKVHLSGLGYYSHADYKTIPDQLSFDATFDNVKKLLSGVYCIDGEFVLDNSEEQITGLEPYKIEWGQRAENTETHEWFTADRSYGKSNTGDSLNWLNWMPRPLLWETDPFAPGAMPFPFRIGYDGIDGFESELSIITTPDDFENPTPIYSTIITSVYARWLYPVVFNHPAGFFPTFPQHASKYLTKTIKCDKYLYYEPSFPLFLGYDFKEKLFILETMDLIQDRQTYEF